MIEIKVPPVGESINEVTLVKWLKKDGDYVERDEMIAELESEKATFEVNAEKAGLLKTTAQEGDTLEIGDVLATVDETAAKPESAASAESAGAGDKAAGGSSTDSGSAAGAAAETKGEGRDSATVLKEALQQGGNEAGSNGGPGAAPAGGTSDIKASPVASAILADKKVDPRTVTPSGYQGKILKHDVLDALSNPGRTPGITLFSRE